MTEGKEEKQGMQEFCKRYPQEYPRESFLFVFFYFCSCPAFTFVCFPTWLWCEEESRRWEALLESCKKSCKSTRQRAKKEERKEESRQEKERKDFCTEEFCAERTLSRTRERSSSITSSFLLLWFKSLSLEYLLSFLLSSDFFTQRHVQLSYVLLCLFLESLERRQQDIRDSKDISPSSLVSFHDRSVNPVHDVFLLLLLLESKRILLLLKHKEACSVHCFLFLCESWSLVTQREAIVAKKRNEWSFSYGGIEWVWCTDKSMSLCVCVHHLIECTLVRLMETSSQVSSHWLSLGSSISSWTRK